MKLSDQFGRGISCLRVSVTDRCNLRCCYCKPSSVFKSLTHEDILTYEEIYRLVTIGATLGINKVRITGGEPLVRKGIVEFIPQLTAIGGLEDVSLTTNGVYLKDNLEKIYTGGIHRINISLDTLRRDRYRQITGGDHFKEIWEAIELALKMNFQPVKINMVVMKGLNDDEVVDMAELVRWYPLHIRFIEYMPIGICDKDAGFDTVPISQIKNQLEELGTLIPVLKNADDGPAERYTFNGVPGEIGFISPMSHRFCGTCNRLRLTSYGTLRPCLLSDIEVDIKGPMRLGATDHELQQIFVETVRKKNREHPLTVRNGEGVSSQMSAIGG